MENKPNSIIKFSKDAHWYDCKDSNPKASHDSTLREARKMGLYPSITTVNKSEFKNEVLERYKIEKMAEAAANNFRQPHETVEAYANRIYEISCQDRDKAALFGKDLHDAIEHYPQMPLNQDIVPWLMRFAEWYDSSVEHPLHREKIMVDHDIGLAGRCDFVGLGRGKFAGQTILPDWKTQNVKKDPKTGKKKPVFYPDWGRQLSFYAVCFGKETGTFPKAIPTCISVIIDSNEPETPFVKVYEKDEIMSHYEDVLIAGYRFFKSRNYWPHRIAKPAIAFNVPLPEL